jgi:DNA-binding LacI/PurR family transcriptional regulator
MAIIKDLAERAEVSAEAVSRALNNRDYLGGEIKRKIADAMREPVYLPGDLARCVDSTGIGWLCPGEVISN